MSEPTQVTRLLVQMRGGDQEASAQLIPLVYKELRKIAASIMRSERAGHTLQPTAVVHEAYLRMMEGDAIDVETARTSLRLPRGRCVTCSLTTPDVVWPTSEAAKDTAGGSPTPN